MGWRRQRARARLRASRLRARRLALSVRGRQRRRRLRVALRPRATACWASVFAETDLGAGPAFAAGHDFRVGAGGEAGLVGEANSLWQLPARRSLHLLLPRRDPPRLPHARRAIVRDRPRPGAAPVGRYGEHLRRGLNRAGRILLRASDVGDKGRLPGLDGLRGVSILLVLVGHLSLTTGSPRWMEPLAAISTVGVAIFFVLSGYLITTLLIRERARTGQISLRRFYLRRALRIIPASYVYVGFIAVLASLGAATLRPARHFVRTSLRDRLPPRPCLGLGALLELVRRGAILSRLAAAPRDARRSLVRPRGR